MRSRAIRTIAIPLLIAGLSAPLGFSAGVSDTTQTGPTSPELLRGSADCALRFNLSLVAQSANDESPALTPCNSDRSPGAVTQRQVRKHRFDELQRLCGDTIWSEELPTMTRAALQDYRSRKPLPNGLEYGALVRDLSVVGKSLVTLEAELSRQHCKKSEDFLRRPGRTDETLNDEAGNPLPIQFFMCPDGSVVRVKPKGDPNTRQRPQPNVVKYVRYPYDSPSTGFEQEAFKVDNEGNAIPNGSRAARPAFQGQS